MTAAAGVRRRFPKASAIAVFTAIAMIAVLAPGRAAHADDSGDPTTTVPVIQGSTQVANITLDTVTGQIVDAPGTLKLSAGCIPTGGGNQVCTGDPNGVVPVHGAAIDQDAKTHAALDWIEKEGVSALAAQYDVPEDGRLETYARPELRAYTVARILDILDKALFGETLTPDETTTLNFLQDYVGQDNRDLTGFALDEYNLWKSRGCSYSPPAAPPYVQNPVRMPDDVVTWCNRTHRGLDTWFAFAPPMPSVQDFQTWGLYRHTAELRLDKLSDPDFQRNLVATTTGWTLAAGTAGALAAGGITLGLGHVAALAPVIASAVGAINAASWEIPVAVQLANFADITLPALAATAAGAVTIVLFFIALVATSIWQFVDSLSTGSTLVDAHDAAMNGTDPLGLATLRSLYATSGTTLDQARAQWAAHPETQPIYRSSAAIGKLQELVTRWTTLDASGKVTPDPYGVWDDNATTADDYGFRITTPGQADRDAPQITVPEGNGERATVRFNRSWLLVTPHHADGTDGPTFATLKFDYVDNNGTRIMASRAPGGGWVITRESPTNPGVTQGIESGLIAYNDPTTGALTTVQIVPPAQPPTVRDLVPTVAGPLVTGRVHNLRPNPVDQNGSFNLDTFTTDDDYSWALQRFDTASNAWTNVAGLTPVAQNGNANYGARFTPTATGDYEATVTMTSRTDPSAPPKTGRVRFTVSAPDIHVTTATLSSDPVAGTLGVNLQLAENVPSDAIDVTVQWPGDIGADASRPQSTVHLTCDTTDPLSCSTPRPEIVDLHHTLDTMSDLRQDVIVTARNSSGGTVTKTLAVDTAAWPHFGAPPVAPSPGQPGVVSFDPYTTHVQLPINVPGADPNYVLAGLTPGNPHDTGTTFTLLDPKTGRPAPANAFVPVDGVTVSVFDRAAAGTDPDWVLGLHGVANLPQVGTYGIPIVVQQSDGGQATMMLQLDVVPAANDLYRGGVETSIDPANFAVDTLPAIEPVALGGRPEWGAYTGALCVSLSSSFVDPTPQVCQDASAYTGSDGKALPFPYQQLYPHGLDAGVHRVQAWVPAGDRTDGDPVQVSFALKTGAPTIRNLTWDDTTSTFAIDLAPFSDPLSGSSSPIASISCTIDGGTPVTGCFDAASGASSPTWSPGALAPGSHHLDVLVTDAAGNYDTQTLAFTSTDTTTATYGSHYGPNEYGWLLYDAAALNTTDLARIQHDCTVFMAYLNGIAESNGNPVPTLGPNPSSGPLTITSTYTADENAALVHAASRFGTDVPSLQRFAVQFVAFLYAIGHH